MPKISGWIYIVIGLFVSIVSWKLDYKKLIIFFYVGLVFIIIGIVKLALNLEKNKISKKETLRSKTHHQPQYQHVKYCHKCGASLRMHHRFCTRCGARV